MKRVGLCTRKAVSRNFHNFHKVTRERLELLKKNQMKKRSETKMLWGVRTFQEWHENKLNDISSYDEKIFNTNLDDLSTITKSNLEYCMCIFIAEVTKVNGTDYPGKTLYQLTVSIQNFLNERGIDWKLVDGPDFK